MPPIWRAAGTYIVYLVAVGASFPYLSVRCRALGLEVDTIGFLAALSATTQLMAAPAAGVRAPLAAVERAGLAGPGVATVPVAPDPPDGLPFAPPARSCRHGRPPDVDRGHGSASHPGGACPLCRLARRRGGGGHGRWLGDRAGDRVGARRRRRGRRAHRRRPAPLREAGARVRTAGRRAIEVAADVTDPEALEAAVARATAELGSALDRDRGRRCQCLGVDRRAAARGPRRRARYQRGRSCPPGPGRPARDAGPARASSSSSRRTTVAGRRRAAAPTLPPSSGRSGSRSRSPRSSTLTASTSTSWNPAASTRPGIRPTRWRHGNGCSRRRTSPWASSSSSTLPAHIVIEELLLVPRDLLVEPWA